MENLSYKSIAIVLAAGSGKRMNSDVPKQFMELAGHPVLYYSLRTFEDSPVDEVILVTSEEWLDHCKSEIVEKYHLNKVKKIIIGGQERYDSVYQGLLEAQGADYVLIHDGARPFVSARVVEELLEVVRETKACVTAVPVKDTIKVADSEGFAKVTPDRSTLWSIQTPQVFEYDVILSAYKKIYAPEAAAYNITDDAMVVESFGDCPVKLVSGEYTNIKLTTPEDFLWAEAFLNS